MVRLTQQQIAWLISWNARYPVAYDAAITPLWGAQSFGLSELSVIYQWKFRGLWPDRKIAALHAGVATKQARSWTARARANRDDLAALCIAGMLPGAGAAGASAVLMVADPDRFTVMDKRAIRSLEHLGRWNTATQGESASYRHWEKYLLECHSLSSQSKLSLRDVDRALYAANGRP